MGASGKVWAGLEAQGGEGEGEGVVFAGLLLWYLGRMGGGKGDSRTGPPPRWMDRSARGKTPLNLQVLLISPVPDWQSSDTNNTKRWSCCFGLALILGPGSPTG